jgi:hypothetical protein
VGFIVLRERIHYIENEDMRVKPNARILLGMATHWRLAFTRASCDRSSPLWIVSRHKDVTRVFATANSQQLIRQRKEGEIELIWKHER